nr:hypothetical protein DA06_17925 [Georgenia sp. SUBG003]
MASSRWLVAYRPITSPSAASGRARSSGTSTDGPGAAPGARSGCDTTLAAARMLLPLRHDVLRASVVAGRVAPSAATCGNLSGNSARDAAEAPRQP